MQLTLTQAERFVDDAPSARWNGWEIEIFTPQSNACLRPNGAFFQGQWCLKTTLALNSEGKYVISKRNAANASKSRN